MTNIKDALTTIAGILGGVGAVLLTISQETIKLGIVLPDWLIVIAGICTAISVAVIGFFNGRNADGSAKTVNQISDAQNNK
jgi:hypothetical protein